MKGREALVAVLHPVRNFLVGVIVTPPSKYAAVWQDDKTQEGLLLRWCCGGSLSIKAGLKTLEFQ